MQEEFLKENKIIEKTEIEKEEELIISILKTKRELNVARQNFEYAQGDLIDYYSKWNGSNCCKANKIKEGIFRWL